MYAEILRKFVALRMGGRAFRRKEVKIDHLLGLGMILGDLSENACAIMIDPRIAEVRGDDLSSFNAHQCERGLKISGLLAYCVHPRLYGIIRRLDVSAHESGEVNVCRRLPRLPHRGEFVNFFAVIFEQIFHGNE